MARSGRRRTVAVTYPERIAGGRRSWVSQQVLEDACGGLVADQSQQDERFMQLAAMGAGGPSQGPASSIKIQRLSTHRLQYTFEA